MKKPQKAKARARPTSGEKAAVKIALEAAPSAPADEPEQLDLIGAPETKALIEARATSTRGRPPGVRNKRTVEWTEYLLNRYASPLEVLAQIATMSIKELVASTGCTKLEALQEKRLAALGLLPYLHSKMPVSIDVTNRKIVYLNIFDAVAPIESPKKETETLSLVATVVEKLNDGRDAQARLEISGAGLEPVHVVDQAGADPERSDRRR